MTRVQSSDELLGSLQDIISVLMSFMKVPDKGRAHDRSIGMPPNVLDMFRCGYAETHSHWKIGD